MPELQPRNGKASQALRDKFTRLRTQLAEKEAALERLQAQRLELAGKLEQLGAEYSEARAASEAAQLATVLRPSPAADAEFRKAKNRVEEAFEAKNEADERDELLEKAADAVRDEVRAIESALSGGPRALVAVRLQERSAEVVAGLRRLLVELLALRRVERSQVFDLPALLLPVLRRPNEPSTLNALKDEATQLLARMEREESAREA